MSESNEVLSEPKLERRARRLVMHQGPLNSARETLAW